MKIPRLNNSVGLHPDHGTWAQYLSRCTLLDTTCLDVNSGWSWYHNVNCHYFVGPNGIVVHGIYGYNAKVKWNDLMASYPAGPDQGDVS
jgi:hypothetical protein